MLVRIEQYKDLYVLSRHAAEYVCTTALESVEKYGYFALALSGGTTPGILYECLARSPFSETIPWNRTHLFWGDERCVPPDHPDSNFFMAHRALISKISIPNKNIHRMKGEMNSPGEAAEAYEQELRHFFNSCDGDYSSVHPFHLILLGVGRDGHTASLFPYDDVLNEETRWAVAVRAPQGVSPAWRITLTLPVINRAGRILFLVSGSEKREVVRAILKDQKSEETLPAARVRAGNVMWVLDFEL